MKAAAMRYADLLENGCFITHHEQDEIAKLLRRLVMTEDEAWNELERKQNKKTQTTKVDWEAVAADQAMTIALAQSEPFKPNWDMIEPYHERIKELEIENDKLRQALAQPEQEPFAWVRDLTSPQPHCVTSLKYLSIADTDAGVKYIPLYTVPPSKPWVSLTDEERRTFASWLDDKTDDEVFNAIEAALRSKNT